MCNTTANLFFIYFAISDGNWTTWTSTECCSSCTPGNPLGTVSQTRTCTNPSPADLGLNCEGDSQQIVSCTCSPGKHNSIDVKLLII